MGVHVAIHSELFSDGLPIKGLSRSWFMRLASFFVGKLSCNTDRFSLYFES